MTYQEILARVDHTLLVQTATWEEIRRLCEDAVFIIRRRYAFRPVL